MTGSQEDAISFRLNVFHQAGEILGVCVLSVFKSVMPKFLLLGTHSLCYPS